MGTRWIAATTALLLCACNGATTPAGTSDAAEPPLETDVATLDAALDCTAFEHPDKPPVLLVHGTFTTGFEQYDWTYKPLLIERGYDVCTVTYPDRGFGDMQISAEYVVYALRKIHHDSGRKVAMIGHSQGVSVPRWAIKWWLSARNAVDDFVLQAGPNHGTDVTLLTATVPALTGGLVGLPAVFFQFAPDSQFMAATNAGDETPGDISYTALYTQFDELVQPVSPVPTAALEFGVDNPKVSNILIQDICPGRFVDHVTIGLLDAVAFALSLDAIEHPGPADVERAGGAELCNALPIVPDLVLAPLPDLLSGVVGAVMQESGLPGLHLTSEEPALKPYAQ